MAITENCGGLDDTRQNDRCGWFMLCAINIKLNCKEVGALCLAAHG